MAEPGTFASAARWSVLISVGQYGSVLVMNLLLARLVGPEPFGLVAMATIFVLFLQLLLQQGLMPAIIQRPDLRREHLDTAFWSITGASVLLTALCIVASGWWAALNGEPELAPLIVVLSLMLPLRALSVVQEAMLRRELDFKPLALRTAVAMTTGGAVGVMLAYAGAGPWALVAQQLVTAALETIVLWQVGGWRPRLRYSRSGAADLMNFSGGSTLAAVGVFANTRADAMIAGLFFGPIAVGWYRLGTRLTTTVVDLASRSLQQAALPELARVARQREDFSRRTLDVLHYSALGAVPVLGVLAACATPLLAILGPEWARTRPGLVLLCWWAAAAAVTLVTGAVLQAAGRPYLLASLQWTTAAVSVATFIVVGVGLRDAEVERQVAGIALSRALLYGTVLLAVNAAVLHRFAGLAVRTQAGRVLPAFAGGAAAYLVGSTVEPHLEGPLLVTLAVTGLVAGACAAAVVLALDPHARALAAHARGRLRRSRREANPRDVASEVPSTLRPTAMADGPMHP